jgi:hypothetical protein
MPRFDFEELRIHRKRLAKFIVVNTDCDHEFARIKTTESGIIDLNADNAAPGRLVERHDSDCTHCGHDTGAGARDKVSNIASRAFTDHARANHDHRAEVCEPLRKTKELIASLQHKWLGAFRSLSQQVTGQFDLDRSKHTTKRPARNRSGKIFDSERERLCFFTRLRGQTHAPAGKKCNAWTRIRSDRQTSVGISQRNCRSF